MRRIQTLSLELEELRRYEQRTPEIQAKERRLEQLRWRLASVADARHPTTWTLPRENRRGLEGQRKRTRAGGDAAVR